MSYDVFLQNFRNGQSSVSDHDAVYGSGAELRAVVMAD